MQAQALCQSGHIPDGEMRLSEAAPFTALSETVLLAETYLVRGKCALSRGQMETSREAFENAERLAKNEDAFIEASALGNLGAIAMRTGHYGEAIEDFRALLTVMQPLHSPLLEEKTLGNLSECYAELGDWKQSLSLSQEAAEKAAEIHNQPDEETWLIDVGRAHYGLWELPEAEKYYLQALSITRQRHDLGSAARCYHNLVLIALRRDDPDRAADFARQEALFTEPDSLLPAFDRAEIALARHHFGEAERELRKLLPGTAQDPALHSLALRDLGKVYWGGGEILRADEAFRNGIGIAEKAIAELTQPQYRMSFMDRDPFYDSYIQFLVAQGRSTDALKIAERSRAQVLAAALDASKASNPSLSVSGLQALSRRRRETILSYSMTDERTFLWMITPSRFKVLELPGHDQIGTQILAFNREIQEHSSLQESRAGAQLYQTLIQPAAELIPKGSSIVIIPSKLLSMVNFEALIVSGSQPHYWIEDVSVEIADSLALLSRGSERRSNVTGMKDLLMLGAPVEADKEFPVLKHAPEEVQRVTSRFAPEETTIISGAQAVPQSYRSAGPRRFRFVHLDTHGVASEINPLESFIVLSPGPGNVYKLYAQEIKDIPLHADLVTISACYGAGTRWYQGEGLVGLAWAFLRAGAHQVIAALWEVDDASTPDLMDDFYSELTQGKSAAEALRDAKLKMLHSSDFHRHPYYWASLQLYTGS